MRYRCLLFLKEKRNSNASQRQGQEECQVALLGQQPLPCPVLHAAQAETGFARELGKELCRRMIVLI